MEKGWWSYFDLLDIFHNDFATLVLLVYYQVAIEQNYLGLRHRNSTQANITIKDFFFGTHV